MPMAKSAADGALSDALPAGQVSRLAAQFEKRQEGTAGPANSRSLSHAAAMHRYAASALENRARTLQWLAAARPGGQVGRLRLAVAVLSLVVLQSWHSIKGPCCAALCPALLLLPFTLMAHDGPSVHDQQALHALASLANLTRWP